MASEVQERANKDPRVIGARLANAELPVFTLKDALPHLRRPFSPEAVKFKVQTVFKNNTGCIVVTYIDARLVIERLNAVCGAEWSATPQPVDGSDKFLWCHLTVFGRPRTDLGQSPKGISKDLWSDALKRAAVQFGVGVSIYSMREVVLFRKDHAAHLEERQTKQGPTLALTAAGHEWLRGGYRRWLESKGEKDFGPVLDHGDDIGAVVDPEVEADEFTPEPPAPVDDDRAHELKAQLAEAYDEIRAIPDGTKSLPPQRFSAWLKGAQHSHKEMERLLEHLRERQAALKAQAAA